MGNTLLHPWAGRTDLEASFDRLVHYWNGTDWALKVGSTVFSLAQRVKKKVKALFEQVIIHLARLLSKTVAGKPPDHQDDPERNRSHWWEEIKNFIRQIQAEKLSESQLRRILEDSYGPQEVAAVIESLREAADMMGDSAPTLFD